MKTKALRDEITEIKEKSKDKTDFEKYTEDTITKFDELQQKFEDERKKQLKMEQQLKVRKKLNIPNPSAGK